MDTKRNSLNCTVTESTTAIIEHVAKTGTYIPKHYVSLMVYFLESGTTYLRLSFYAFTRVFALLRLSETCTEKWRGFHLLIVSFQDSEYYVY
jgi:hypothetical protein